MFASLHLFAQAAVTPETDFAELIKLVLGAVQNKNWALVASLAVVILTWLSRTYGARFVPFLATDAGGAVTVITLGVSGAITNSLLTGGSPSVELIARGIEVGLAAAGGYATVRKILKQFAPKLFAEAAAAPSPAVGETVRG